MNLTIIDMVSNQNTVEIIANFKIKILYYSDKNIEYSKKTINDITIKPQKCAYT